MIEVMVWFLMIDDGSTRSSAAFMPSPFTTEQECKDAGDLFKESPLDIMEGGAYLCVPQKWRMAGSQQRRIFP